jgi:outer membrane protein TolC
MKFGNQRKLLIFLTIISATLMAQENDSITLGIAVKSIIDNSRALRSAEDGELAAEARTGSAYSNYFPTITGTATFANIGPVTKLSLPMGSKMVSFQLYPDNNYDAHIGAEYLLYDFGKRHTIFQTSHLGEQGAKIRSSSIRNAVAFQAVAQFSTLLIQELIIREKRVDSLTLERHLDFIKKKVENGSATEFDVLGTQVQLTSIQGELNNLNNEFIKNQIEFCELAGLSQNKLHLKGSFDSTYHAISTDSLLTFAINNRSEIAALKLSEQAAALQLQMTRKEMSPSLVARANAGIKNGYTPEVNNPKFNWTAGAALQVPLFDGFKSKNHIKEAELKQDSLNQTSKDIQRRIRIEILKGIQDVNAAYTNMVISETNVKFANEAFRIANIQYESGTVTNLNVLDAEISLKVKRFLLIDRF